MSKHLVTKKWLDSLSFDGFRDYGGGKIRAVFKDDEDDEYGGFSIKTSFIVGKKKSN